MGHFESAIKTVGEQVGVLPDGVAFVLRAVPQPDPYGLAEQIDAEQFCWRVHDMALHYFADSARSQLAQWGIVSTEIIGQIVLGLASVGLLAKLEDLEPQHVLGAYRDIYDFAEVFEKPHFEPLGPLNRWTIGGIFGVMTIVSVALPGFKANGFEGGIGTLLGIWLAVIGTACILLGLRKDMRGRAIALVIGVAFLVLGVVAYVAVSSRVNAL